MKVIKIIFLTVLFSILLSSCINGKVQQTYSELIRTGEYYTAEQINELTAQALDWQSTKAGIGELEFKYKITKDLSESNKSEWMEMFFADATALIEDKNAKIINITELYIIDEESVN